MYYLFKLLKIGIFHTTFVTYSNVIQYRDSEIKEHSLPRFM